MRKSLNEPTAIGLIVRRPKDEQLVQRHSETVNVASLVGDAVELFGSHVAQRTDGVARARDVILIKQFGESKIGDPYGIIFAQQQICRLDVAM